MHSNTTAGASVTPTSAETHIQIRPFRNSDSENVKALYLSAMVEDESPFVLAMRSHKTAPLSLASYSVCFTSLSVMLLSNTSGLRYLGLASVFVGVLLFFYPLRSIRAAFDDYISKSLQGDMKDIATHYGLAQDTKSGYAHCVGKSGFWVAEASGNGLTPEIVGCVGLDINTTPDQKVAELRRLVVSSKHRRRGIAQKLLQAVVHHARSTETQTIFLTTTAFQVPAINMYKKLGFRVERIREVSLKFLKISVYHFIMDVVDYKM